MSELNGNQVAQIDLGETEVEEVGVKAIEGHENTASLPEPAQLLANDVLSLIDENAGEQADNRFWEIIRDHAIGKVGLPVLHIEGSKPLDEKSANKFLESLMPCGKYTGQKIRTILKKDKDYLLNFSKQPSAFQIRLRKFLIFLSETKEKV